MAVISTFRPLKRWLTDCFLPFFYHHFAAGAIEVQAQCYIALVQSERSCQFLSVRSLEASPEVVAQAVAGAHEFAIVGLCQLESGCCACDTVRAVETIGHGVGYIGMIVNLACEPLRRSLCCLATVGAVGKSAGAVEPFDGLATPCR